MEVTLRDGKMELNSGGKGLRAAASTPVSAIMTREVFTVRPDLSLQSLIETMMERGVGCAPVLDERGTPVGIVSKTDLVLNQQEQVDGESEATVLLRLGNGISYSPGAGFHVESGAVTTVEDVMTTRVFTLPEDASVARATEVMVNSRIHHLPIVSSSGAVVGMLSSMDVLRWVSGLT